MQANFNTIQLTILSVLGAVSEKKLSKARVIYLVQLADKKWKKEAIQKRLKQFHKKRLVNWGEEIEITKSEAKKIEYYSLTPDGEEVLNHVNVPALLEPIKKRMAWGTIGEGWDWGTIFTGVEEKKGKSLEAQMLHPLMRIKDDE